MCDCPTCQEETFAEIRAELAAAGDAEPRTANKTSSSTGADATRRT